MTNPRTTSRARRLGAGWLALLAITWACSDTGLEPDTAPSDAASRIELNVSTLRMLIGNHFTVAAQALTADGRQAAEPVMWTSEAPGIASIDAGGVISANGAG